MAMRTGEGAGEDQLGQYRCGPSGLVSGPKAGPARPAQVRDQPGERQGGVGPGPGCSVARSSRGVPGGTRGVRRPVHAEDRLGDPAL